MGRLEVVVLVASDAGLQRGRGCYGGGLGLVRLFAFRVCP